MCAWCGMAVKAGLCWETAACQQPFKLRGRAWKEQALLREEGADRSFQGNTSQQLLPTIPMESLPLHCGRKAGLRGIRDVQGASACSWRWRHTCLAPAQSSMQA